ncbi:MAG TPA: hypothetical protein VFS95_02150 [Telluria sp.]|nr:hypothetical protein [Telluria sp.]
MAPPLPALPAAEELRDAPNGSIYFHRSCFLDDYSQATFTDRHWFMHEMVRS